MNQKKVEKYDHILKRKKMVADLVKIQFNDQFNMSNERMAVGVLGLYIPRKENMDFVEEELEAAAWAIKKAMNRKDFQDLYTEAVRADITRLYPKAIKRFEQQVDDVSQPWLANKAANDIVLRYDKVMAKEDGATVTVRFEGMPEIGEPYGEE